MTTTALATTITPDQLELVKRTVAQGATDAELKLYLYDCARHGVHPLDKLLHFTKRGGKYTPITSIDLMRIRAADTGACMGISDAVFSDLLAAGEMPEHDFAATVTVKRLVQGLVADFTATARWAEYYPGDQGGHMWRKMPHTMLGKCAEGLALRKAFPQQLAGLYAKEEMEQADNGRPVLVEAAAVAPAPPPEGYNDWLDDLHAVAEEGTERLLVTWKATKPPFRKYLTDTDPKGWEAIKAKAAKVVPRVEASA